MNIIEAIKDDMLVPIHPAGWPFIGLFAAVTLGFGFLFEEFLIIGVPATLWCVYFFRNPPRVIPSSEIVVIAPADGRVIATGNEEAPAELGLPDGQWRCISIFMNVFDVHVNRSPFAGQIGHQVYVKGRFVNASLDKAHHENERMVQRLDTQNKQAPHIGVVQIAGLVARRILCDVKVGDKLSVGQQFGLIRFGSRVDIWLPESVAPLVLVGQKTIAGETILADLSGKRKSPAKSKRTC